MERDNLEEDLFLKGVIFENDDEFYEKLQKLHKQKLEVKQMHDMCKLSKPFVVEFCGTPRTYRTFTINNLYDFFRKRGFSVTLVEEFTTSKYYKEILRKEFDKMSVADWHMAIMEEDLRELKEAIEAGNDIVLVDRSINDRQVWNYRRYLSGEMAEERYFEAREKYLKFSKELVDFLVIGYADSLTALKRDYHSTLSLEKRSFMSIENLDDYNNSLLKLRGFFNESVRDNFFIDTSFREPRDIAVEIAFKIMDAMKKRYSAEISKNV